MDTVELATPSRNVEHWRTLHERGYFAHHPYYQDRLHDLGVAQASRMLDPRAEDTLLEVGCGYGRLLWHLLPRVRRVVGVDLHPAPLEEARELLADRGEAELRLGDGHRLPLDDRSVDKVVAFTVLQHMTVDGARGYLREMVRVLKPGGRALVNFRDDGRREARMLDLAKEQCLNWSPAQVCDAAEAAGARILHLERQGLTEYYPDGKTAWWWLVFGGWEPR